MNKTLPFLTALTIIQLIHSVLYTFSDLLPVPFNIAVIFSPIEVLFYYFLFVPFLVVTSVWFSVRQLKRHQGKILPIVSIFMASALFIWFYLVPSPQSGAEKQLLEFKQQAEKAKEREEAIKKDIQSNKPLVTATSTLSWLTCRRSPLKYEIKYPADWKVWDSYGSNLLKNCEESKSWQITLSPDDGSLVHLIPTLEIEVSKDTVELIDVQTIDDLIRTHRRITQVTGERVVDGERAVIAQDGSLIVLHNRILYVFSGEINGATRDIFLSTFRFLK